MDFFASENFNSGFTDFTDIKIDIDGWIRNLDEVLPESKDYRMSFTEFLEKELDPELWGIELDPRQLVIIKSFYGEPLTEAEQSILEYWQSLDRTTYNPELGHYSRGALILEAGRRSGKSMIGALLVWFEFIKLISRSNPQHYYGVASNTLISILCLAPSGTQAKRTIYGQVKNLVPVLPRIKSLVEQGKIIVGEEEIKYPEKKCFVYSGNSKSDTQVGSSTIALIMDECSRFQDKGGTNNALELWDNIGAAGLTFREDARRIAISSAWCEGDAMQQLYKAAGRISEWLGFRLESRQVNPKFASDDNPVVKAYFLTQPERAMVEYYGLRSYNSSLFFNPQHIKRAFTGISKCQLYQVHEEDLVTLRARRVVPLIKPTCTYMHLDPALSRCAYAMAFGHMEKHERTREDIIVIDGLGVWSPDGIKEVSITNVRHIIETIHKVRPLSLVSSDQAGYGAETLQLLKKQGIATDCIVYTNQAQCRMYGALRELLNEGRIILPKDSEWTLLLQKEMYGIVENNGKIIAQGGSDFLKEDESRPAGSKDLIDAVVGLVWQLLGKKQANYKISVPVSAVETPVTNRRGVIDKQQLLQQLNPVGIKQSMDDIDLWFSNGKMTKGRSHDWNRELD